MTATELLYEQNKKTIFSKAWEYSKKSRMDFDELVAEGNLIFCESLKSWKGGFNASFNTYLTHSLSKRLIDYTKGTYVHYQDRVRCRKNKSVGAKQQYDHEIPSKEKSFFSLDDFTGDSRIIAEMVILENVKDMKSLKNKLRELNWTWERISKGVRFVKTYVRKNERRGR